ncbi:MAG: class I SAM-dependent RNA methyltransferase, partial [Alphaproteobacteria bacterium]|nr:class I SAM-dependent RNA methyltransferase [Alphaproteobacteria bacterium]
MTRAIDLTITTLGNQGDGLAPYENDVVSIPHTLPGEVIRTTIAQQKEHIRGTLLEVITPSPQRATPPCPVFGKCGGCRLQHMDDASYRAWKLGAVNHLLEKNDFSVRAETIFV